MDAKIDRYKALRRDLLAVEAEMAEHRRAYLADGVHCPVAVRAELESRRAAMRLEIHDLRPEVVALHESAKKQKHATFLHLLVQECQRNGQSHLVDAARQGSVEWMNRQGLGGAYAVSI